MKALMMKISPKINEKISLKTAISSMFGASLKTVSFKQKSTYNNMQCSNFVF